MLVVLLIKSMLQWFEEIDFNYVLTKVDKLYQQYL